MDRAVVQAQFLQGDKESWSRQRYMEDQTAYHCLTSHVFSDTTLYCCPDKRSTASYTSLESRTSVENGGKGHVFIYQVNRTVATTLTASQWRLQAILWHAWQMAYKTNRKSNARKSHCVDINIMATSICVVLQRTPLKRHRCHNKNNFTTAFSIHGPRHTRCQQFSNMSPFRDIPSHIYKVFYKEKPSNDPT